MKNPPFFIVGLEALKKKNDRVLIT